MTTRKQAKKASNGGSNNNKSKTLKSSSKVSAKAKPQLNLGKGSAMAECDDILIQFDENPDDQPFDLNEILTPKSSLQHLQQQMQVRGEFNALLNGLHYGKDSCTHFRSNSKTGANNSVVINSLNASIADVITINENSYVDDNDSNTVPSHVMMSIDFDDIKEEIAYWESAVVCYVLGANPHQNVMEGYVRRIWGKLGVDKVSQVGRGIYLVRFTTMENCSKVVNRGHHFFDAKPLIVKPWTSDENFSKDPIKTLPIWIQLPGLDVKYWGEKSLGKIVGQLGVMIKVDLATKTRDKLMFARVLIEVKVDQEFPSVIHFLNEKGVKIDKKVNYDWIPITCTVCRGMGMTSLGVLGREVETLGELGEKGTATCPTCSFSSHCYYNCSTECI